MANSCYVIGVDFGTDSVRAIVVNAFTGKEESSSVFNYPRWADKKYCDPSSQQYRQHPLDYIEGLEFTVKDCLSKLDKSVAAKVVGISVDTTGSTPVAVNKQGIPLALLPGFEENANAMFILWKDHTSIEEAETINLQAQNYSTNYLKYVGGVYSSEWFWAKIIHTLKVDSDVSAQCYTFVEHCDWIPYLLTGAGDASKLKRGRCSAGHKGLWAEEFSGYPPYQFFSSLHPGLERIAGTMSEKTYTADEAAGKISPQWAERLGVSNDVIIGIGAFDAHMGAVGGQIEPYVLSKVIGTSTCDILVVPPGDLHGKSVKGICGQVNGSVIPGLIGLEAGQSAFGDFYAWFTNLFLWPFQNLNISDNTRIIEELTNKLLPELVKRAAEIDPVEGGILATDWINGRRTPDADQKLKSTITGLDLASDPVNIFRSIVEATCFGARAITDRFNKEGVPIKGVIGLGGIAKKSPFIMQTLADVLKLPIQVHSSDQTCALGAAMFAATAAKVYPKIEQAMTGMGQGFCAVYYPDAAKGRIYETKYQKYLELARMNARPAFSNSLSETVAPQLYYGQ